MAQDYAEFDQSDDNEDDDDEIGALGSILSWDEDEDGVVGTSNVGVNSSTSALPELVSFNHMKDKDGDLSYLQQSLVSNGAIDTSTVNLPLPTKINYEEAGKMGQNQILRNLHGNEASVPQTSQIQVDVSRTSQQDEQNTDDRSNGVVKKEDSGNRNGASVQQQAQLEQQQQQIRFQQQQIQQQQQQIQQHQLQQQIGIQQQQHRMQQHMVSTAPAPQQTLNQAQVPQQTLQSQQPQVVTQQQQPPQVRQVTQQPTNTSTIPTNLQGALSLLQQNALMAQNSMVIPAVSQSSAQEKSADQQQMFADPNSILRRIQVAQLQQQFNAVQQAQAVHAQAHAQAQAQAALQQRMHFPGQVQMVPSSVPPVASAITASHPPGATLKKINRLSSQKPSAQTKQKSRKKPPTTKSPVVSASDTDGEFSLNQPGFDKKAFHEDQKKFEFDMSNMTPDMRQKANRERNREHAKNTRLRKKAYLETLKCTVNDLCQERDTLVTERAGAASILVEMNNTRTEVLMSFFALRSANEKRRQLWASILDESSFSCILPVTPYRSFPASEVQVSKCQRTVLGIDGMMSDTASLHVLVNTLVDRSRFPTASIAFRYTLVTEEAVVAGNQMMARWVMQTLNATQCGARTEVSKQGMLCCKFNSAHKIVGLELMFDVMALMLQLKQAAGSETFSVIPNTVQTCQRSFDTPMVMILADEPYTIVQVNKLWEDMSGYKADEVVGKTSCRILEGGQTDVYAVSVFMNEVRFKRPTSAMILHYKKSGERFKNFFLAYPLSTDSRITHYLIFTSHVGDISPSITDTTTMSENRQHEVSSFPSVTTQAVVSQSNFLHQNNQNLRANFNAAQQQLASAVVLPNSNQITTLPSTIPTNAGILPRQQQQELQIKTSKRPNETSNSIDIGSPIKQIKIDPSVVAESSASSSKLVILSDSQAQ